MNDIFKPNFYPRRRVVIVIENDTIGDDLWNPHVVKTLRDYADYSEKTQGAGDSPQCFKFKNGNKLTVYSGTYCEAPILDGSPERQG